MFLAAFVSLAAAGYLAAGGSGSVAVVCVGALTAVGVGATFCGLAWLLDGRGELGRDAIALVYIVVVTGEGLFAITVRGHLIDTGTARSANVSAGFSLAVFGCACAAVAVLRRRPLHARTVRATSVLVAAFTSAMLITAALTSGDASSWLPPTDAVVATVSHAALRSSGAVLLALLYVAPRPGRPELVEKASAIPVAPDQVRPAPPVPSRMDQRQDNYLVNHYMSLHVTLLSLALGVAGLSAGSLLADGAAAPVDRGLMWLMWTASLLAAIAAFSGTMSGSFVLPARIPAIVDLAPSVVIGLAELLMFAVLAPALTGAVGTPHVARAWFAGLAAFSLATAATILRVRAVITHTDRAVLPAAEQSWYRRRLGIDLWGPAVLTVLGLLGLLASTLAPTAHRFIEYPAAALACIWLALGVARHGQTARHWRTLTRTGTVS